MGARLVTFAGWNMPLQYKGILHEHDHTRRCVSVFDTCHMGELALEGHAVCADLSRLISSNTEQIEVGRCRYGLLLNEGGGILDDLVVYRRGKQSYMLVANAGTTERDREWIGAHVSAGTTVADQSEQTGKIDVQGPRCLEVLEQFTDILLERLGYYRFATGRLWEFDVVISRTGYTGELGYEVYSNTDAINRIWERLLEQPLVEPAGLGARDTLRLEVGYPLYGQDMDECRTPLEASLERHVDMSKEFIGKRALVHQQEEGTAEKLVGVALDGRQAARHGSELTRDGETVGTVTSGSFAPSLGYAIALGYVRAAYSSPGTPLEIKAGSRMLQGRITELPFYRRGTARSPLHV